MTARRRIGNVEFTVLPFAQTISTLLDQAANMAQVGHPGMSVHFANAYNVALARDNHPYAELLNAADYVFSDGVPITWIGKRAYPNDAPIWDRVYGPDVMTAIFEASGAETPRHYLLGSTPDVIDALTHNLTSRFPNAAIVGAESPPFTAPTAAELEARDARIRASRATMVWVGLGTPKQDHEVSRLAAALPVMALAVGAAFDFLAGTKPQAPVWVQRNGLEWAYRFAKEPARLGKRYLWGNSVFLLEAARTMRAPRTHG